MSENTPKNTVLLANAGILAQAMVAAGAASIAITYRGSGDEGYIEHCDALDAGGEVVELSKETQVALLGHNGEPGSPTDLLSAAEELYYATLSEAGLDAYEDNEGGFGEWRLTAQGRIVLDHNEHVTETVFRSHEFGPDDPGTPEGETPLAAAA